MSMASHIARITQLQQYFRSSKDVKFLSWHVYMICESCDIIYINFLILFFS